MVRIRGYIGNILLYTYAHFLLNANFIWHYVLVITFKTNFCLANKFPLVNNFARKKMRTITRDFMTQYTIRTLETFAEMDNFSTAFFSIEPNTAQLFTSLVFAAILLDRWWLHY
jgi:hypothetical protein